ncbi:MAG: adenine deaminase [Nitrospirota bacterium]
MDKKEYIEVSIGEKRADILLKNAKLVDTISGEIIDTSIAIYKGFVIGWGDYNASKVIDLHGDFVSPGLIDGHIHIESTMMTPGEFCKAVIPDGTTSVIADPHEIANVTGIDGIVYFLKEAEFLPLNLFIMLPSSVPSTNLETSGARIIVSDLSSLLSNKWVLGLAEVMNYNDVIRGEREILEKIGLVRDKRVDGHAPGLKERELNAYIMAGITSDHECTSMNEAKEKLQKGMHIMIREGTNEKNLKILLPLVNPLNSRHFSFVTDDKHPIDMIKDGHIDYIVRKAVKSGLSPIIALQMVTINTAVYFGLRDLGALAPGYKADMVVFDDLYNFRPKIVFKDGRMLAKDGVILKGFNIKNEVFSKDSIHIDLKSTKRLDVRAEGDRIRVIQVFSDQIITKGLTVEAKAAKGRIVSDTERDILKIAVFERHRATGRVAIGFVKGFGLKHGAIASSVGHDSHNIVAVGTDDIYMSMAVEEIVRIKGGLAAITKEKRCLSLPLPVAGLMSEQPLQIVAERLKDLLKIVKEMGTKLPDPFMALSFVSLPVIPEIRITDMGLVDVAKGEIVSLFLPYPSSHQD